MNGKHPIDDLFGRTLRDAEVTPPPAVWESIVHKRVGRATLAQKLRRSWGLSALLLLLSGAGSYVALNTTAEKNDGALAQPAAPTGATILDQTTAPQTLLNDPSPAEAAPIGAIDQTTTEIAEVELNAEENSSSEKQNRTAARRVAGSTANAMASHDRSANGKQTAHKEPNTSLTATVDLASAEGPVLRASVNQNAPVTGDQDVAGALQDLPNTARTDEYSTERSVTSKGSELDHPNVESAPKDQLTRVLDQIRSTPNETLPGLGIRSSPLPLTEAKQPGPLLSGKAVDPYVLANGNWWFGLQLEWAAANGSWSGTGSEVNAMNTSETWLDRKGLSAAVGREWQSGLSVGLGVGLSQQRSRFLHRLVEPSSTQTVVDTTWTGTPSGPQTIFTWDIVEIQTTEPGAEQLFRSTNLYTQLRIAPEISYRLLERRRLSLHVRLSPIIHIGLSRNGNALVLKPAQEASDSSTTVLAVSPLEDAALNDRFPLSLALSGGLDLRYQLCDRLSIGLLPSFVSDIQGRIERTPKLTSSEFGGMIRLRYDIRHKERRMKQPTVPVLP